MEIPFPWMVIWHILAGRPQSARRDAQATLSRLRPPLLVEFARPLDQAQPCVITINHYTRPGLLAWWMAIAVSGSLPAQFTSEVHWVTTAAWTYSDPLRSATITPLTRWFLERAARVYGFTTMPPMPPRPQDAAARAQAVRQVLRYAKTAPCPVIGLAPEGGDFAQPGELAAPPPGLGRFLVQLARAGLCILPCSLDETGGRLRLRFGELYSLEPPPDLALHAVDAWAGSIVMRHIRDLTGQSL